ncbi:MAG: type II toxin-antitoxin system RelB/DinJ family antitoxin [Peptococcaceae bacterium]|nr:type II toxin-antitoxin system RelB/DinJ family antitoxin [Peptococcaceae bacterium]
MRSQPRAHFLLESLGITLSDVINLFLHQSLREGGPPFEVKRADAKKTQE